MKEHNFISAVIGIREDTAETVAFLNEVYACLQKHFTQYEVIAVNMNCAENNCDMLRSEAKKLDCPVTIINMSSLQPSEQCMNAGMDCAIGDYIYEFDTTHMPYQPELIWKAYELAQKGNDIVTVCPTKERWSSKLFYRIFNAHSRASYQLRTTAFRLISRRALNRAHAMNENLPYRKAAFATSGLKIEVLEFDGCFSGTESDRFELAVDSLVLYTDFGYRFSIRLSMLMMLVTIAELIYTLVIWLTGHPIAGWTTTMFVITFGMTGLFALLTVLIKYLSILLRLNFRRQAYQIESIDKI